MAADVRVVGLLKEPATHGHRGNYAICGTTDNTLAAFHLHHEYIIEQAKAWEKREVRRGEFGEIAAHRLAPAQEHRVQVLLFGGNHWGVADRRDP